MRETWVRSLGREDPLEKEMATHSCILAWRIPWMEEPGGLQSMGLQRVGHDWVTSLSLSLSLLTTCMWVQAILYLWVLLYFLIYLTTVILKETSVWSFKQLNCCFVLFLCRRLRDVHWIPGPPGVWGHLPVPTGQGFFSCGFLWGWSPHTYFNIKYCLNLLTMTVWNTIHSEPLPRGNKYPHLPPPPCQKACHGTGAMGPSCQPHTP